MPETTPEQSARATTNWRTWKLLGTLVAVALIVGFGTAGFAIYATRNLDAKLALRPDPGMETISNPPFTMTNQDGETVTEDIFTGNLTVLEFGFTHCPTACVVMMNQMLRLQDELEGTPARFLFVSVDPAHDTPERLKEYATENGADLDRWNLVTGETQTIETWLIDGLNLALETQPETQIDLGDGSSMDNIAHPSHLILVGPNAEILGLYQAFVPEQVDLLVERVKQASKLWE